MLIYGTFYGLFINKLISMKSKMSTFSILITFTVLAMSPVFSQDTSQNQKLTEEHTYPIRPNKRKYNISGKHHIYRDTRLGGSSPYFNTYQKNDYGAGAITTDPNKGIGVAHDRAGQFDSSIMRNKMHGETRLGGSSPGHRTYQSNDYDAGAITTNPHKDNNSSRSSRNIVYPARDSTKK